MRVLHLVSLGVCAIAVIAGWTTGFSASAQSAHTMQGTYAVQGTEVGNALSTRGTGTLAGFGRFTLREGMMDTSAGPSTGVLS